MGKPSRDAEPQERTVSPACEAQPPLKPVAEGPLSPTRSTNIAESSREPEGRLQVADELAEGSDQRMALLRRIQELEVEGAVPERREAAKARKKLVRDMQALIVDSQVPTQEKFDWLQQQLLGLVANQAKLEKELIPLRKREGQALRERDEAKFEAQRALTINAKLQELCRQLQQQNKAIVEQAKETVGQEQLSRQEFTEKVGETLKSVTSRIEEQTRERDLQQKENTELRDQLGEIDEKWSAREELFAKQLEAKGLEAALWQQRVQAQQDLVAAGQQREAVLQEQMATLRTQVGETSNVLEQHLTNYSQYQQTIDQSSQVLRQMKEEEQQREATIKLLEKGKRLKDRQLKQAQQCADQATEALAEAVRRSTQLAQLVDAAGGQQQLQEVPKLRAQKCMLEKLSRTLQEENRQLKAELSCHLPPVPASVVDQSLGDAPPSSFVSNAAAEQPPQLPADLHD